jgi:hypothetical protein
MTSTKPSLLPFVLAVLVVLASAFSVTYRSTITYHFNLSFTIGAWNSDPLDDIAKYDMVTSPIGGGGPKMCGVVVTNQPGQTMPSEQIIISQVRAQYDANGKSLAHNEVVDIFVSSVKVAEAIVKLHH